MSGHPSTERLADYLAGFLEELEVEELEEHLFSCEDCAIESGKLASLAAAIRDAVPPVLSAGRFGELEREGRIAAVNSMAPGQTAEVRYPPGDKLLVHRLGGSDLRMARRVDVALLDLQGRSLSRFDDVPFDSVQGEILVACQRHYADLFPHDTVFRVEVVLGDRREESIYTVLHRV
jgi:Putative zinc-finger